METVILAAGGVVRNEKNEILLIYRKQHWDLPKGKLDEGESIEECAVREVQEETGLRNVQLGSLIGDTLHRYEENGQWVTKKTVWYHMRASSTDKLTPQTEEDIQEIRWVKPGELEPHYEKTYSNIILILKKSFLS